MADKSITIRASTADQGWCDLERGCYIVKEQLNGSTFHAFYPGSSEHPPTRKFTEEDLNILHQW